MDARTGALGEKIMSDVNEKVVKITRIKIFLVLAFVAIGVLSYQNCELNQKLEYYAEMSDEFHKKLYAQVEGSYKNGAHTLSISDIYYRKYFKSEDK